MALPSPPFIFRVIMMWMLSLLLALPTWSEVYFIGGSQRPWDEMAGETYQVDLRRVPGSLLPLRADPDENIALGLLDRGGDVLVYHWYGWEPEDRFLMVDGDPNTAYIHYPRPEQYSSGWETARPELDLGTQFMVGHVRIYPREGHEDHMVTKYDFYLSAGWGGMVKYKKVRTVTENLDPVIDIFFPPQLVRFIKFIPRNVDRTWEIAEFEVYGAGYVPHAHFVTKVIDFGTPVNWGVLRWAGERDPGCKVFLRTRTGTDPDPEVYWRKTGVGTEEVVEDPSGRPLTREMYYSLPRDQRGKITEDTENWSTWSSAYPFDEGRALLASPGPRRYLQVKVEFFPTASDGARLDSIWVEYSPRIPAEEVVGEITPTEVSLGEPVTFTYLVRPRIRPGQLGFDTLELQLPERADRVQAVRIDGKEVNFSADLTGDRLIVRFPKVTKDRTLVEVVFSCRVFRYGTTFKGWVSDSSSGELPQPIYPGDVKARVPGNTLTVRTSLGGRILGGVTVEPEIFSPNGDGMGDEVRFTFTVLKVVGAVPVHLKIFSPSGELERSLSGRFPVGEHTLTWDGRDDEGKLVPPGVYLCRITVSSDEGEDSATGSVGVCY